MKEKYANIGNMQTRERLQKMMHFLAGAIVILHGIEHMDTGGAILFYLVIGVMMLTLAFFHEGVEKKFPKIAGGLYLLEAMVLLFIAFEYFEENKKILPLVYLIAATAYCIAGYIFMTRKVKVRKSKK
jgi:hypothetical protein